MMRHTEMQSRLDDLVDGVLPPAEYSAVMEHVDACAECRAELDGLVMLRAETEALPRDIAPPRDLWPDIAARLQPRGGVPAKETASDSLIVVDFGAASRRSTAWRWAPLAAAAVMLVVLSSGITAYLMRARQVAPVAVVQVPVPVESSAQPVSALAAFRPTEVEYLGVVEAMQAELDARRGQLAPQTVATIEENLRIIDRAIGEARAALEKDPSDGDLPLLLSSVYQKKVELLQTALQLTARSL